MKFQQIKSLLLLQTRRRISALYVTGDKANENYAVLTPFMEFSKTLCDEQNLLRENITRRRLDLDLNAVMKTYEVFRLKEHERADLDAKREEIALELKQLQKGNQNASAIEAKKREGINLRNNLKTLKEQLYPIEDDFIHAFLKLPNQLHHETPNDQPKLLYRQGLPPKDSSIASNRNHLEYKDIIDYRDPTCYYLLNEASHFDFYTPVNCVRHFLDHNYIQFVNPDFARTLLLEAANIDLKRVDIINEDDVKESKVNLLHLIGGGSVASFLGFITKLTIFPTLLPFRFIASGREYVIPDEKLSSRGLYTAAQSSTVQTFLVAKDAVELNKEVESTLGVAIDIFRQFNIHFRIVYLPAHQLNAAESLRASIQMFSSFYNDYIEVGYLSNYSDFVSKRLLFNWKDGKSWKFPHIAGGSILNVTKILACLVENNCKLTVPFATTSTTTTTEEKYDMAIKNFKNLFS